MSAQKDKNKKNNSNALKELKDEKVLENKEKNTTTDSNKTNTVEEKKTNNSNEVKKDKEKHLEKKSIEKEEKKELKNTINTEEFINKENKKKAKIITALICLIVFFVIIIIFSVIFAIVHTAKSSIAQGVSINGINVSKLTYEEASKKIEKACNEALDIKINLKYKDYSYIIESKDIELTFNYKDAIDEAYNIGRSENIIKSNYSLIYTGLFKKDINYSFSYNEDELNRIISEVSTSVPGIVKQYSYYIEDKELVINPGQDGIEVDNEKLKNMIKNEISKRDSKRLSEKSKIDVIEIPFNEVKAEKIDIEKIYSEIHTEPKDAYYTEATETTKFAIYPDIDGIDFAITMDEAKEIISQEGLSEYSIPINRKKANITINDIGIEAFPYKISEFDTRYDASYYSRSENLRIAASKIDGTVLMPGEQFSFNAVVGERTVAEGYKDAKIFSDGQVVDGLAGGICQISSTLYNAALLANLQIDERYNHSFTTSYIEKGRDATVVYGVKDLKFTNTRNYPIKIDANVANGVATFVIYGIEEENEYKIRILPQTISTIPYTVETIVDPSLAPGQTEIKQAGASGYKVVTYKETSLNGVVISNEVISNDTYKTMTRIIKVGPEAVPVVSDNPAPAEPPVIVEEPVPESVPEPIQEPVETPVETPIPAPESETSPVEEGNGE